ncbi:hypothetical protein HK097_005820, partial [Rhizophlyctis rosea]
SVVMDSNVPSSVDTAALGKPAEPSSLETLVSESNQDLWRNSETELREKGKGRGLKAKPVAMDARGAKDGAAGGSVGRPGAFRRESVISSGGPSLDVSPDGRLSLEAWSSRVGPIHMNSKSKSVSLAVDNGFLLVQRAGGKVLLRDRVECVSVGVGIKAKEKKEGRFKRILSRLCGCTGGEEEVGEPFVEEFNNERTLSIVELSGDEGNKGAITLHRLWNASADNRRCFGCRAAGPTWGVVLEGKEKGIIVCAVCSDKARADPTSLVQS